MMRHLLATIAVACAFSAPAHAGLLVGTSVTGALSINGSPNVLSSSPVVIASPSSTFSFTTTGLGIEAVFTDTTLLLAINSASSFPPGMVFTFKDSAFKSTTIAYANLNISGLTFTHSGDTLSITLPGQFGSNQYVGQFTFSGITPSTVVPEPSSAVLSGVGAVFLAFLSLRRRFAA